MTRSARAKLQPKRKVRRNRTIVYLQSRNIHDGTGREVYSISIPRWVVEKLKLRPGDALVINDVDAVPIFNTGGVDGTIELSTNLPKGFDRSRGRAPSRRASDRVLRE